MRRAVRFWWQRRTRGWDDSETWNLDWQLAKWIHPRLVRYREVNCGHPCDLTMEQWNKKIDDFIWLFSRVINSDEEFKPEELERYESVRKDFGIWMHHLWW